VIRMTGLSYAQLQALPERVYDVLVAELQRG
jgi:hypothetical protein